ncbi:hypothetical protein B0H16DRAFT_1481612 [Mycena metata]|uniref:Uncharacterized protein n=1 Tax=Mycena metata TaxID=1033252 RepID=A0AAD7GXG2_9AGAR|nr:hypothetical protein B0H16DRAFT_1481612 [Mycena metata]
MYLSSWRESQNLENQDTANQARQLGRTVTVVLCDLTGTAQVGVVVQKITVADGLGLVIDILVKYVEVFSGAHRQRSLPMRIGARSCNLNAVWTLTPNKGKSPHMGIV